MPVVYLNPITGKVDAMPIEMIGAYIPNPSDWTPQEAAKIAAIRDDEAATNLLLSITEPYSVYVSEGNDLDVLSVEPTALR